MAKDSLTLKWGTLKEWHFTSEKGIALCREYDSLGCSLGAATQRDTPRQKEIICELIDEGDFDSVYLDWDDKHVTKAEAKDYVLNYRKGAS